MPILEQLLDDVVVHKFEIIEPVTRIGRKVDNDIVIEDTAVSALHAQILVEDNEDFAGYADIFIEDLGSTNGTFLNEQMVVGRQRLRHNDTLRIAWNQFKFIDENEPELERTRLMVSQSID